MSYIGVNNGNGWVDSPSTLTQINAANLNIMEQGIKDLDAAVNSNKIVAGTIYNNGSGWAVLDDAQHTPINIDSVSVNAGTIVLNHSTMGASEVRTLTVNSDETFIAEGYSCGASVGLTQSIITVMRNKAKGGYVYYNGSAFAIHPSYNNGISSIEWEAASNSLKVTLANLGPSAIKNVSVSGNGLSYVPMYGGDTAGVLYIQFRDFAGALITAPDSNCKVWVTVDLSGVVDAANLSLTGGNFWIYGLFR